MADLEGGAWDRDAFWFPTRDMTGLLLAVFLLLSIIRFDELFGLHDVQTLLFGFWPTSFAYHVGMSAVHVGFAYLLYRYWPEPQTDLEGGDTPWETH